MQTCSGLSLDSTRSDVSTTLNTGFDLGLNFDAPVLFEDATAQTEIQTHEERKEIAPSGSVVQNPLPPLPTSSLNLNLDWKSVAASWCEMGGNNPIFTLSRKQVMEASVSIPDAAARVESVSLQKAEAVHQGVIHQDLEASAVARYSTFGRGEVLHKSGKPAKLERQKPAAAKKVAKKPSNNKRRPAGKSSDKRPRIKGRFVTREELEVYIAQQEKAEGLAIFEELVPEYIL